MDRDDAVGLAEAALVAVGAYVLFGVLLFMWASSLPGFLLVFFGFCVAALAMLSCLFLPWFPLISSTADPGRVLSHVAYQLRRRGLRVEQASGLETIRLGSTVAVRIRTRGFLRGSKVSYQTYATPAGWGTLITMIVLVWGAPASLGASLYVFRKARRFARGAVVPLVLEAESAAPAPEDEVRTLLISGLSEAHRLAAEAYEALRSSYMDSAALLGVTAGLAWVVVFVVLLFTPVFAGNLLGAAAAAVAVGVLVGLGLYAALRRGTGRRLEGLRSWSDRLQEALSREAIQGMPEPPPPCSVELLFEASGQIPTWLQARRQAGLSADQVVDWVVFVLSLAAFWTGWAAVEQLVTSAPSFPLVMLEFAAAVGLALAAYLTWGYWKRKRDRALARTRAEWRQRIDALQAKLDGFFQDL